MLPCSSVRGRGSYFSSSSVSTRMHCFLLGLPESHCSKSDSPRRNTYSSEDLDFYFSPIILGLRKCLNSFLILLSQGPHSLEMSPPVSLGDIGTMLYSFLYEPPMSSLVPGGRGGGHSPSQRSPNCLPKVNTFPSAFLFSVLGDALEAGGGGSPWEKIREAGLSEKGKSRPCKLW